MALTPAPSAEDVRRIAAETKAARDDFFSRALGRAQLRPAATAAESSWYLDRTAGVGPEAAAAAVPAAGLLGATPATAEAWTRLLEFAGAIGWTVRERDLPATFEGTVKGGANPETRTLLLAPAATAEDSDGVQTVVHELAHALLHNARCLPRGTSAADYAANYSETAEEREADLATMLTLSALALPLERDDGTSIPAATWRADTARLRGRVQPQTLARAQWAAGVLARAAREGAAAAPLASDCPAPA